MTKDVAGQVWEDSDGTPFLRIHDDFGVPVWVSLDGNEMANSMNTKYMKFKAESVRAYIPTRLEDMAHD